MKISYDKLWHLLKERHLTKTKLCQMTGISTSTLHKMKYCEAVNTDSLIRICEALRCDIVDISQLIDENDDPSALLDSSNVPFEYNPITDTLTYNRPDRTDGITKLVVANYLNYLPNSKLVHPDDIGAFSSLLKFAGKIPASGRFECMANVTGSGYEKKNLDFRSLINNDGVVYKVLIKAR